MFHKNKIKYAIYEYVSHVERYYYFNLLRMSTQIL